MLSKWEFPRTPYRRSNQWAAQECPLWPTHLKVGLNTTGSIHPCSALFQPARNLGWSKGQQQAEEPPGLACKSLHELVLTHLIAELEQLLPHPLDRSLHPHYSTLPGPASSTDAGYGQNSSPSDPGTTEGTCHSLLGLSLCLC